MNNFENKKICILGFGKEGNSTYNYIRKHNKNIFITIMDKNFNNIFVNDENINIIDVDINKLNEFDLIFKTPGISLNKYDISSFEDKITSQVEYFLENAKGITIGITGTKGKSTTSSLIYKLVSDQKDNVFFGGNIGKPILDFLDDTNDDSITVLELSAHQLEYTDVSPNISLLLNLYEEHLDHFLSLNHYYESKLNIAKFQNKSSSFIYFYDSLEINKFVDESDYKAEMYTVSVSNHEATTYIDNNFIVVNKKRLFNIETPTNLKGNHNIIDIMFALNVSEILELDCEKSIQSIKEFKPLEHRLEFVGIYNNVTYYNDSISTIPETCINAIEALKNVGTLIVGGMDRKIDYNGLIMYLRISNIDNIICMPDTGIMIKKEIEDVKKAYFAQDIEKAVEIAKKVTKKGSICLLSPAASSYNQYKNFEERGNRFKDAVRKD